MLKVRGADDLSWKEVGRGHVLDRKRQQPLVFFAVRKGIPRDVPASSEAFLPVAGPSPELDCGEVDPEAGA